MPPVVAFIQKMKDESRRTQKVRFTIITTVLYLQIIVEYLCKHILVAKRDTTKAHVYT
jgi:hypothetical protein